jgi:hypothetical protein
MAFARQNRGSNVRIPYARIAPMHDKMKLAVPDPAYADYDGRATKLAREYDGLETAELAWIMAKQFRPPARKNTGHGNMFANVQTHGFAHNVPDATTLARELQYPSRGDLTSPDGTRLGDGSNGALATKSGLGFDGALSVQGQVLSHGGFGPDRLQRMASTDWVMAYAEQCLAEQTISLHSTAICNYADGTNAFLDSDIAFWSALRLRPGLSDPGTVPGDDCVLGGATLLCAPDLAYALQQVESSSAAMQVQVPMMQGLNVMEMGPFLTSYGRSTDPINCEMPFPNGEYTKKINPKLPFEVPRHLGSSLAQQALACELKKIGLLNWVPDGICLSKLENGPDPYADAEYDARSGQLFNIGVQGPCITKTWSTGRSDMEVLPGDKLFILVVADVMYGVGEKRGDNSESGNAAETAEGKADALVSANADVTIGLSSTRFRRKNTKFEANRDTAEKVKNDDLGVLIAKMNSINARGAVGDVQKESENAYMSAVKALSDGIRAGPPTFTGLDAAPDDEQKEEMLAEWKTQKDKYKQKMQDLVSGPQREAIYGQQFQKVAEELRGGRRSAYTAEMGKFRLMKATSSWLTNTSHIGASGNGADKLASTRCGLKIGFSPTGLTGLPGKTEKDVGMPLPKVPAIPANTGAAEYIVGGWCVGTVIDSAASRALGHNGIRTRPSSMAYNVNVNVEWWDADQLHAAYADEDRGLYARGESGHPSDTKTLRAQSTTVMRTENAARTPASLFRERREGYALNANVTGNGETADSAYLAHVTKGEQDFEGAYITPDPQGANTDPDGMLRVFRDGAPPMLLGGNYYDYRKDETFKQAFEDKYTSGYSNLGKMASTQPSDANGNPRLDRRVWREALAQTLL